MSTNAPSDDGEVKYAAAVIIAIIGLIIPAVRAMVLARQDWKASDIATIVGTFTTAVGTLVGAILGVQVGAAGKEKSEAIARRALAALPPEMARQIAQ